MITKNVSNYETERKLYEFTACPDDVIPFKQNGTLPKDAVCGSTVTIPATNRTYIYSELNATVNGVAVHEESWVQSNSSSTAVALIATTTYGTPVSVSSPADTDAVKTALGTGLTVKKVNANGSTETITFGTTAGTNYQLEVDADLTAGNHEALIIFRTKNVATTRAPHDDTGAPVMSWAMAAEYGTPAYVSPAFESNTSSVYVFLTVPYKIT